MSRIRVWRINSYGELKIGVGINRTIFLNAGTYYKLLKKID
jgi:hypothetical protein